MQVKKVKSFHIYAKDVIMPGAGIEPAHPFGTRDFKSLASTSSAIPAKKIPKTGLYFQKPLQKITT
jgi:hypothetical protein